MIEVNPVFNVPDQIKTIIEKYFRPGSVSYIFYYTHCIRVTQLALKIAKNNLEKNLDVDYLVKGAMLHDIGIVKTDSPEIGCFGKYPYIAHTYLGKEIVEQEGLPEIAPICERHIGVGLTKKDIIESNLPLPARDMVPVSLEEKLICYADKFYSKSKNHLTIPKPLKKIRKKLLKYGENKVKIFDDFTELFGIEGIFQSP
ncbi:MAG: HD domain-containing protein [Bacteroidales bacterium]|nr:HD domain-containing protein [Bacteroidales bacterium]